jgi:hypothetical protein
MYHRLDLFVQENVDRIKLLSTILMISCLVSSIALFYLAIKSSVSLYFVYSALFILIILFYFIIKRIEECLREVIIGQILLLRNQTK